MLKQNNILKIIKTGIYLKKCHDVINLYSNTIKYTMTLYCIYNHSHLTES